MRISGIGQPRGGAAGPPRRPAPAGPASSVLVRSRRPVPRASAPAVDTSAQPGPTALGTVLFLILLLGCGMTVNGATPVAIARYGAVFVLAGLGASILADSKRGLKNLIRPDLMALVALYFLTLFEFLFPQDQLNFMTDNDTTRTAVLACCWGFA